MEANEPLKVRQAFVLSDSVVIVFDNELTAVYPTPLLLKMLPEARIEPEPEPD